MKSAKQLDNWDYILLLCQVILLFFAWSASGFPLHSPHYHHSPHSHSLSHRSLHSHSLSHRSLHSHSLSHRSLQLHSIPLTHNQAEASEFQVVDDKMAYVSLLPKYMKRMVTGNDVTLMGNPVFITCDIFINDKRFIVLLDTGSALLAVPTPACETCEPVITDPNDTYTSSQNAVLCSTTGCLACCAPSVCDSTHCAFQTAYADGSGINGSLYQDKVTLGGLTAAMTFGGITQESKGFVAPYADGIMGFSQEGEVACSPTCVPPVFSSYVKDGLVSNSFGIYLNMQGSGELTLGGVDTSLQQDSFIYTPLLTRTNYYTVRMDSVIINGNSATPPMNAILDTGTTLIMLPVVSYNLLVDYFQNNYCDLPAVCSTSNIFNGHCLMNYQDVETFPDITIKLSGVDVDLSPETYLLATGTKDSQVVYCFGFDHWDQDFAILGYTFMKGHYVHYDIQNNRIGIAATSSATTATVPASLLVLLAVLSFLQH